MELFVLTKFPTFNKVAIIMQAERERKQESKFFVRDIILKEPTVAQFSAAGCKAKKLKLVGEARKLGRRICWHLQLCIYSYFFLAGCNFSKFWGKKDIFVKATSCQKWNRHGIYDFRRIRKEPIFYSLSLIPSFLSLHYSILTLAALLSLYNFGWWRVFRYKWRSIFYGNIFNISTVYLRSMAMTVLNVRVCVALKILSNLFGGRVA